MSCYVGDSWTKFELILRENMGTHSDFSLFLPDLVRYWCLWRHAFISFTWYFAREKVYSIANLFAPCSAGQAGRQVVRGAAAPPLTVCLLLLFEPETFYTSGLLNEDQISYKRKSKMVQRNIRRITYIVGIMRCIKKRIPRGRCQHSISSIRGVSGILAVSSWSTKIRQNEKRDLRSGWSLHGKAGLTWIWWIY
jgi:hypothetical protein